MTKYGHIIQLGRFIFKYFDDNIKYIGIIYE